MSSFLLQTGLQPGPDRPIPISHTLSHSITLSHTVMPYQASTQDLTFLSAFLSANLPLIGIKPSGLRWASLTSVTASDTSPPSQLCKLNVTASIEVSVVPELLPGSGDIGDVLATTFSVGSGTVSSRRRLQQQGAPVSHGVTSSGNPSSYSGRARRDVLGFKRQRRMALWRILQQGGVSSGLTSSILLWGSVCPSLDTSALPAMTTVSPSSAASSQSTLSAASIILPAGQLCALVTPSMSDAMAFDTIVGGSLAMDIASYAFMNITLSHVPGVNDDLAFLYTDMTTQVSGTLSPSFIRIRPHR